MEINGIAHSMLTVGDFATARAFYSQLLPFLGLSPVLDSADTYYCVGGRTALGIRASEQPGSANRFDQNRSGLHHLCFRLRQREDVDELHHFLQGIGARIVHPPQEDATIRYCSRTRRGSGWRRILCPAGACSADSFAGAPGAGPGIDPEQSRHCAAGVIITARR